LPFLGALYGGSGDDINSVVDGADDVECGLGADIMVGGAGSEHWPEVPAASAAHR